MGYTAIVFEGDSSASSSSFFHDQPLDPGAPGYFYFLTTQPLAPGVGIYGYRMKAI